MLALEYTSRFLRDYKKLQNKHIFLGWHTVSCITIPNKPNAIPNEVRNLKLAMKGLRCCLRFLAYARNNVTKDLRCRF